MEILESRGELGNLGEGLDQNGGRMNRREHPAQPGLRSTVPQMAQSRDPDRIELVGTEVFRRATNVEEFRDLLPKPLSLWILKPEEEAVGSFLAACWGLRNVRPSIGQLVVIDLGGGSLELVGGLQANPPLPLASVSMGAIGTLSLREAWMRGANSPDPERAFTNTSRPRSAAMPMSSPRSEPRRGRADQCGEAPGGGAGLDGDRLGLDPEREVAQSVQVEGGQWPDPHRVLNLQKLRDELLRMTGPGEPPHHRRLSHGIKDVLGHQLGLAALLAVMDALGAEAITACGTGLRFGLAYAFLHNIPLEIARSAPDQ